VNTLTKLSYHTPFDWPRMLRFLHARSVKGVEAVRAGSYLRTVQIGSRTGWISVR
jgi:AraC family transcriptional regulator, regulatory protein of adaptative response / DNA-3-methyladenine glycosylase II